MSDFKPNIYIPSNIRSDKRKNNLVTESVLNNAISLLDWMGIDLKNGNNVLFLAQNGQWLSTASSSVNIYNTNGVLTGNRTLDGTSANSLLFDNLTSFTVVAGSLALQDASNNDYITFNGSNLLSLGQISNSLGPKIIIDYANDKNILTSDDIEFTSYPNTRDDSGATTPINFLYTDTSGNLLSAPYSTPTSYTFSNGLTNTAGTVKLGGALTALTTIQQSTNAFRIQNGTTPGVDLTDFFNLGANPFNAAADGLFYVKLAGAISHQVRVDATQLALNRNNASTGRAAGIYIRSEASASPSSPDIVIESKATTSSTSRYGISMDNESTEMYRYNPVVGADTLFLGVDGLNHQIIGQVRNNTTGSLASQLTLAENTVIFGYNNVAKFTVNTLNGNITSTAGEIKKVRTANYGSPLTFDVTDYHLALTGAGTGGTTIDITAMTVGEIAIISDLDRKALLNNITLDSGGGNTIISQIGAAQTFVLALDGISVTIQRITATQFMVISTNS